MSEISRRSLCIGLPALGMLQALAAGAQNPPISIAKNPAEPHPGNALHTDLSQCMAFPETQMHLRYSDAGAPTRDILRGTVPTGEMVELHRTTLTPGMMPHPAHQHPHEEFLMLIQGTVEFFYDRQSHILEPGSVGYVAPNQIHGFRNAGKTEAQYFIVSLSKKY